MTEEIDYKQLAILGQSIKAGTASKADKDRFMFMLYQHGNINADTYSDYIAGRRADFILRNALAIGAILLVAWLAVEFVKKK